MRIPHHYTLEFTNAMGAADGTNIHLGLPIAPILIQGKISQLHSYPCNPPDFRGHPEPVVQRDSTRCDARTPTC